MTDELSYHMTPGEFREYGRMVVDWIADYYEQIEHYPVLSQVEPGDIRRNLPPEPPLSGESIDQILSDIDRVIMPGITHWQSPNFFGYFPANVSGPSILGELLSAGLGVQGMLWSTSPACTELETHLMDWVVDMLGLPQKFKSGNQGGGVIQDSASSATLCALLAARERATRYQSNEQGIEPQLIVYATGQTHSSLEKAVKIAGLGRQNLRIIQVDEKYAMRPDDLQAQIRTDRESGFLPCFVSATLGTTSSNGFDPVPEIGQICRQNDVWLHVDAAMAGTAAICPEFREMNNGLDLVDSYCFNPHKWMFTNFDCDCFFVADRSALIKTLSILPEYLRNRATESGAVIDYRDWQIPLGRRFRALKLWFVIRHYGIEGLQYHIRQHVATAREFADWVAAEPGFELAAPVPLNLVCFRYRGDNALNQRLLEEINKTGKVFLTHTILDGKYTLRMVVGGTNTQSRHVRAAWDLIRKTAVEVG